MERTIFFTQLYYPDITTTAIIMTDLAEDLAKHDLDVNVVSAQPTYLVKDKSPKTEIHNNVSIKRIWSFNLDKNKNLGRLFNSASCFISMFFALFSIPKDRHLIFNTNPALLPLLGVAAAKFRKQHYSILVHDLWPELPAHIGMISKGGLIYKIISSLMNLSFRYADKIIVLSQAMKTTIAERVPGCIDRIRMIHNWADNSRVYPVSKKKNQLLDKHRLNGQKVIMYSGNLGRYQPLETMIQAAAELKDRADILFLFTGDGAKKPKLVKFAKTEDLTNVRFLPFQPLSRLAESLSMADISLMGILPENEGVIMPSKLYGLLAVGKPIICLSDPSSEVAGILRDADAGIQTSIDDPKELARHIVSILDDPERAKQMGQNCINYFQTHFERKIVTRQWYDLLTNEARDQKSEI